MNLYCIKHSTFTKSSIIKKKSKIDLKLIFILIVLTAVLKSLKKEWS